MNDFLFFFLPKVNRFREEEEGRKSSLGHNPGKWQDLNCSQICLRLCQTRPGLLKHFSCGSAGTRETNYLQRHFSSRVGWRAQRKKLSVWAAASQRKERFRPWSWEGHMRWSPHERPCMALCFNHCWLWLPLSHLHIQNLKLLISYILLTENIILLCSRFHCCLLWIIFLKSKLD